MTETLRNLGRLIRSVMMPIHQGGWPFLLGFALISCLLALVSTFLGTIGLVLTAWCAWFFRHPERVTPTRPGIIVSPADGLVLSIEQITPPSELILGDKPYWKISIFLNIFDVHVQRIPCNGTISQATYFPGSFLSANLDKASTENERMSLTIQRPEGEPIACVQIAGLVARRIICSVGADDRVSVGDSYGLIRFGSRVDLYLPLGMEPLILVGQRVIGGETIITEPGRGESKPKNTKPPILSSNGTSENGTAKSELETSI